MAAVISFVGGAYEILFLLNIAVRSLAKYVFLAGGEYRTARFGSIGGMILYFGRLIDTNALQLRHWDINTWTDEEAKNWKDSQLASFSAIAVAGAIFAGIGLTALQLPDMSSVHWSARACCISSMVLGVLSVTTSTKLHQAIGMLKSPLDIRLWLSRGRPTVKSRASSLLTLVKLRQVDWAPEKYAGVEGFSMLPLESSISGLKAVALPRHLLDLAVILFMVGIGIYELSGWKFSPDNLESSHVEYRNVFIVFIITLGLYIIYDVAVSLARVVDDDKRNTEFDTNTLGGFHSPKKLRELETSLKEIRKRIDLTTKVDDLLSKYGRIEVDLYHAESAHRNMGQDLAAMRADMAEARASNGRSLQHDEDITAHRGATFERAGTERRTSVDS